MQITWFWMKKKVTPRGVRRVPVSSRSLTGEVDGTEFESSLERDLMMLMTREPNFDWFQSQPVEIEYEFPPGKIRHYTPDLLLNFSPDSNEKVRKPELCEVKYKEDLEENWSEYRHKFKAATTYCRERGWKFRIYNEKRIRGDKLTNIQFLWMYRDTSYDILLGEKILQQLQADGEPVSMMPFLTRYFEDQLGTAIWAWWCLVSQEMIMFDWDLALIPVNMKEHSFWLPEWRKNWF